MLLKSGISSATSKAVTGKSASTTYAVRVRARDAAGNWSALSTSVDATTSAGGGLGTQHTVFGATAHPGTFALGTDGTPNIELGHGFYRYGSGTGFYPNMRVVGMRIWKPTGITLPANFGIKCYSAPGVGASGNLGTERLSKLIAGHTWVDGWNSFYFDTQYTISGSECLLMMYRFTDPGDVAKYLYTVGETTGWGPGFIAAVDGTKLALSESGNGDLGYFRGKWKMGSTTGTPISGGAGYGVDIIVDEGAP